MAQLMPLPLTVSCFSKIQIGFTFLVLAHLGSPGQRAVKWVCVCVCVCVSRMTYMANNWLARQLLHGFLYMPFIIIRAVVSTSVLSPTFSWMWPWPMFASIPWLWPWPMSSIAWRWPTTAIARPRCAFTTVARTRPTSRSWSPMTAMIATKSYRSKTSVKYHPLKYYTSLWSVKLLRYCAQTYCFVVQTLI